MTVVSINQPAYLPWLGYFHRIAVSDVHVVLDHVQFEKNSATNRNRVRLAQGPRWLTVPVRTGGRFGDLAISGLETAGDGSWRRRHLTTLEHSLARAPHFGPLHEELEVLYSVDRPLLLPLLEDLTRRHLRWLGITTRLVHSSAMAARGAKSDLVLGLCRELGATTYLSGAMGRDYLDLASFERAGIEVRFQDYRHPVYRQALPGFEPRLCALDLIANAGPRAMEVLMDGQEPVAR